MYSDCDVLIVGAGPAGSSAAYDLASGGISTLLVDRQLLPRTKPCGGAVTIKALKAMRFSIDPIVRNRASGLLLGIDGGTCSTFSGSRDIAAMTLRTELDHYLLERAIAHGAQFRKINRIMAIEEKEDHVLLTTTGSRIRSKFLIGADGANSTVRRMVFGGHSIQLAFAIEGRVPASQRSDLMEFHFGAAPQGYGWVFPKDDHLNVGIYSVSQKLNRGLLARFITRRFRSNELEEVLGYPIGIGGWSYSLCKDRVLLAGDAAGLAEPLLGEGIYYAIRSGQVAAGAILSEGLRIGRIGPAYSKAIKELKKDLYSSHKSQLRLYSNINAGHRALTFPPITRRLVEGYADGKTFGQIKASPLFAVEAIAAYLYPARGKTSSTF